MFVAKSIAVDHKDLIHDVSYDFHGRRMATCSSDQTVKVWEQGDDGTWHCTASWKTHSGSVWRVTWAHPEFGQVLATCSFDRTAAVWEKEAGQNHWLKRTSLVDSRTSVTDVKFAPKHMGLQLATSSADGIIRIYEAVDVMNLSNWSLQHEFNCHMGCSCLTWNTSRVHPPLIAMGSDDPNPSGGPKVKLYEYSEVQRKWNKVEALSVVSDAVHDIQFAPNVGRSYHLLAVASKELYIFSLKPYRKDPASNPQGNKFEIRQAGMFDCHDSQVWRVSWNVIGTILVSSGADGCVRMWKANYLGNWKCISELKGDGTPGEGHAAVAQNNQPPGTLAANGSMGANNNSSSSNAIRGVQMPHLHRSYSHT
ncbi:nucleoporin SEH1-like isoform X2 [Littorina saxatilis]|uniref:nucleoporin SEH1-like isoform X2 n=1 Tax=Littorina saxatilis TaxID=31220 RepID=UPI0038B62912